MFSKGEGGGGAKKAPKATKMWLPHQDAAAEGSKGKSQK